MGSQQLRPEAWEEVLAVVARLAERLEADGEELALLNLGGGLPSRYMEPVARAQVYGDAIQAALDYHLPHRPHRVLIEPGRYVTGDAGFLITEC